MATPHATRESYYMYGPARAGRRAVLLLFTLTPHKGQTGFRARSLHLRFGAKKASRSVGPGGLLRVCFGPQTTVNGNVGLPPAGALIWISVPILGHTPQS